MPSEGCLGKVILPSLLFTAVSNIGSLCCLWLLVTPVALCMGDLPKSAGELLACGASVADALLLLQASGMGVPAQGWMGFWAT